MITVEVNDLRKVFRRPLKSEGFRGLVEFYLRPRYDRIEALRGISFEAFEGEILTILGPNGAGKTTTLKILSGIIHPTAGSVRVLGFVPYKREKEFLRKIGFLSSQKRFAEYMGWDLPPVDTFSLIKTIYGIDERTFKKRMDFFVDLLDVKPILNVPLRKLSLGQRAKIEIITAVLHYPKVLFLDEPTLGLDVVASNLIRNFIKEYIKTTGATVLFTSHYMSDVENLTDRLIIINRGQIIFEGKLSEIYSRFSKFREVRLVFESPPERLPLSEKLIRDNGNEVVYRVEAARTREFISGMLERFQIKDITIQDESLEEIIRNIFGGET